MLLNDITYCLGWKTNHPSNIGTLGNLSQGDSEVIFSGTRAPALILIKVSSGTWAPAFKSLLRSLQELGLQPSSLLRSLHLKSTAWIFPLYFQIPYLPEETCSQQAGSSSAVEDTSGRYQPSCTGSYRPAEGTSQAVLGSSDQRKVPASLSPISKK